MITRHNLIRVIVIGFIIGVGYALGKAFYWGSFMGIVLAMVSLSAAVYFLYTLGQAKKEMEEYRAGMENENAV